MVTLSLVGPLVAATGAAFVHVASLVSFGMNLGPAVLMFSGSASGPEPILVLVNELVTKLYLGDGAHSLIIFPIIGCRRRVLFSSSAKKSGTGPT